MANILPVSLKKFDSLEVRICIDHNEGNWKMPFEWHDSLEIFYVLDGTGQNFIENKFYSFEKGDLFVISNNELHKSQIRPGEFFDVFVVMFDPALAALMQLEDGIDPLAPFFNRPKDFCHQIMVPLEHRPQFERILYAMKEEYERKSGYSIRMIASLLQCLLVETARAYETKQVSQGEVRTTIHLKEIVSQSIDYVEAHFTEDINLTRVAEEIGCSPAYLSSEFKKNIGISFVDFISVNRVQLAKDYLVNTNDPITDIAMEVGYKNVTHFNVVFKKLVGSTPSQYRKKTVLHH